MRKVLMSLMVIAFIIVGWYGNGNAYNYFTPKESTVFDCFGPLCFSVTERGNIGIQYIRSIYGLTEQEKDTRNLGLDSIKPDVEAIQQLRNIRKLRISEKGFVIFLDVEGKMHFTYLFYQRRHPVTGNSYVKAADYTILSNLLSKISGTVREFWINNNIIVLDIEEEVGMRAIPIDVGQDPQSIGRWNNTTAEKFYTLQNALVEVELLSMITTKLIPIKAKLQALEPDIADLDERVIDLNNEISFNAQTLIEIEGKVIEIEGCLIEIEVDVKDFRNLEDRLSVVEAKVENKKPKIEKVIFETNPYHKPKKKSFWNWFRRKH